MEKHMRTSELIKVLQKVPNQEDFQEFLRKTRAMAVQAERTKLKEACAEFLKKHQFSPGDLVKWKDQMKYRKRPDYDEPVVVVEVLESPHYETSQDGGSGSPYYMEPLDIVLGFFDDDGDFVCLHYDSRRFETYE